jgi:uroporphyrinogen decarboxylase
LDWNMDIKQARKDTLNSKMLQGNLDPCVLYADKATIKKETEKMLKRFGPEKHIANLGHGLYPDIEADKVKYFIDVVKNYSHNN